MLATVLEKKVKGSIPIKIPSAKKTYYVFIKDDEENKEKVSKKNKEKASLLIAYCLDNSAARCAYKDEGNTLFLVETSPSDETVFANYSVHVIEDSENPDTEITLFFSGEAKHIIEDPWKQLRKRYGVSPLRQVAAIAVVGLTFFIMYNVFFKKEEKKPVFIPKKTKKPIALSLEDTKTILYNMSANAIKSIIEETRVVKPEFFYIESVVVKPVSSVRITEETGYEERFIEKALFPFENGKLSRCGKYPCWKRFATRKSMIKNMEYVRNKTGFFKYTPEKKKQCYKYYALKYLVDKVSDNAVIFKTPPKLTDKVTDVLVEIQKDVKVCPFIIKSLQINNGKINFKIEL